MTSEGTALLESNDYTTTGEDGKETPSKTTVTLPDGWLTVDGFRSAMQRHLRSGIHVKEIAPGVAELSRKYNKPVKDVLCKVYPIVEVKLTYTGKFRQCHVECQKAERLDCECRCLGLYHRGGTPNNGAWTKHYPNGVITGHEGSDRYEETIRNVGLPSGGNDLYYMAEIFGQEQAMLYMQWYENELAAIASRKREALVEQVKVELDHELRTTARELNAPVGVVRFRLAKKIESAGYGTVRKAVFGTPGNAEEVIINYVVDHYDGNLSVAIKNLKRGSRAA